MQARLLVAEQLGGVSKIMRALGQEVKRPVTFDSWKENKIIEELSFSDIRVVTPLFMTTEANKFA